MPSLSSNKFPSSVNFISWNYDLQIELAYAKIRGISINLAQREIQVFPSPAIVEINENASSIIKVNGTAGLYFKQNSGDKLDGWINESDFNWNDEYVALMAQVFYNNSSRIMGSKPSFKFYFEEPNPLHNRTIECAKKIMSKTDVLVVIGYSFHPPNRLIDQEGLHDFSKLKKVIIQTQESDYELVKNNLKNIIPAFNGQIELYKDLRNFPAFNNLGEIRNIEDFATSGKV